VEETSEDRVAEVVGRTSGATSDAIVGNDITPTDANDVIDKVNNGTYDPNTATAPEKAVAEAAAAELKENTEAISKELDLEIDPTAPANDPLRLSDESNPVGKKNANTLRGKFADFIERTTGIKLTKEKTSLTDAEKKAAEEAQARVKEQLKTETSPGKMKMLQAALAILSTLASALALLFKLNALKDFLENLARGMDSCSEVNLAERIDNKLSCGDSSSDAVKTACVCGADGVPAGLTNLCTNLDATHTCPTWKYVYQEYHWYNVLPALAADIAGAPQGILDWFVKNKWTLIIGAVVIIAIIFAFGYAKHYIFKSNAPAAPAVAAPVAAPAVAAPVAAPVVAAPAVAAPVAAPAVAAPAVAAVNTA